MTDEIKATLVSVITSLVGLTRMKLISSQRHRNLVKAYLRLADELYK